MKAKEVIILLSGNNLGLEYIDVSGMSEREAAEHLKAMPNFADVPMHKVPESVELGRCTLKKAAKIYSIFRHLEDRSDVVEFTPRGKVFLSKDGAA